MSITLELLNRVDDGFILAITALTVLLPTMVLLMTNHQLVQQS